MEEISDKIKAKNFKRIELTQFKGQKMVLKEALFKGETWKINELFRKK